MRHAFDAAFDVPDGYLNTPAVGVPPAHVADEVTEFVRRWSAGAQRPPEFDALVESTRTSFGALVGVPAERVAVGAAVSPLVGMVAAGVPDGARVLAASGEFTSVTFPFAAHRHRGVTVGEVPVSALPDAVAGHDLVAVSVAQSADGALVELDALREAADVAGVPVLLDVTQAAGWRPLHLDWADWVVGAGYKWLLAPRGTAWLAVHPRAMASTHPVGAGWYAGEDPWDSIYGLPLRLAGGARRFDTSPAWLAFAGAAPALSYVASLDLAAVRDHGVGLANAVRARFGLPEAGGPIVSLRREGAAEALAEAGVVASVRAGAARLGFHIYNTERDVDRVVAALS
ncbi:aminotransferase class V-fold PLP-dependent enzyme [Saccharomonospora piscinae]|uniref:aminotransferase class V-fold PLP-dependent enzyme n=1 Tax=Saccharomonospora piscinae TaxID=687388 RepID=UPI00110594E9|nr:aminotransferase class V-fold PLP-dependent enzyme [Saccharomonospora piscinae]TLW90393.1 aminotransferase class V-fold PLP-dependent enzyme [Saccharomonospora piscinae]